MNGAEYPFALTLSPSDRCIESLVLQGAVEMRLFLLHRTTKGGTSDAGTSPASPKVKTASGEAGAVGADAARQAEPSAVRRRAGWHTHGGACTPGRGVGAWVKTGLDWTT